MNSNSKRKIHWFRILDCLYMIVFPVLSILILLVAKRFTNKYTLVAGIIFILIYLIALLSFRLKKVKAVALVRRFIMILLCIALAFALNYAKNIADGLTNLVNNDIHKETLVHMDLMVKNEREEPIGAIDDLNDMVLGYQTANEKDNSTYVLKELDNSLSDYQVLEYGDYNTMLTDYYNGYVDAIIINQNQKNLLPEDYQDLYSTSKVLKTYNRVIRNDVSGNDIDVTKSVFTVLISAADEVGTPASNSLSDMNMLLIINPMTNQIVTVPLPRDAFVPNPAYDNENDKLTHTGSSGINNTVLSVEQMMQIEIDFYVKISFSSLIEIVDTLGGIEANVLVSFEEQDENRSFEEDDLIRLNEGYQELNGKQALAYARHRHNYQNQDLGRNKAQLEVIKGIINKLTSQSGIDKIDDVLRILPRYVITNFSDSQLSSFIKEQVDNLEPWSLTSLSLSNNGLPDLTLTASGGYEELSVYYLSQTDIEIVNAVYNLLKNPPKMADFEFNLNSLSKPYSTFEEKENLILAQ